MLERTLIVTLEITGTAFMLFLMGVFVRIIWGVVRELNKIDRERAS